MTESQLLARLTVAAVDLDDTLLRSDGELSPRTLTSLNAWLTSGRRLVIATGRPPRTVGEKLPPFLHNAPWICYNGAEIRYKGCVLYQDYIPAGALTELIPRVLREHPDATVGMEIDDRLWVNRERSRPGRYRVGDLTPALQRATPKAIFFSECLDELVQVIGEPPAGTRLMPSGRYAFVQLMSQSADKLTALRHLLAQWALELSNVVAIGDDVNDVEMITNAGMGVAVSNALDRVKAAARYHTHSNDEDGVAVVLEEILRTSSGQVHVER